MADNERTDMEIREIDNSGYVPKVIPTYVALGFFDEYAGRKLVEGGEIVEAFYARERACAIFFVSAPRYRP
jgi:hypothetical protein